MNKEKILKIISENIKRPGIEKLTAFLLNNDYFTAPASTQFHGVNKGDLANHSLLVYELLSEKNKKYNLEYSEETLAICGLFHDLCKVNFYKEKETDPATDPQLAYIKKLDKNIILPENISKDIASKVIERLKVGKEITQELLTAPVWVVDDQLPIGHGEKSIFILQQFIDLTNEEAMAIRWHMVAFDAGIHFNYPTGYPFRQAIDKSKLVTVLFTADFEADKVFKK